MESQLQNGENHNSGMMKTTNQEFSESQFQNGENHHSRIVEITKPEYPKSQSNNTDINKTDIRIDDQTRKFNLSEAVSL